MPIPQTTYVFEPAVAMAGMVADMTNKTVLTKLVDIALDAGQGVVTGADGERCKLPVDAASVANFQGVALYDASKEPRTANRYKATDAAGVLRRGRVWVKTDAILVVDGPVYLVNGSGGGVAGNFRPDADTAAATLIAGAKVVKVASASLAMIEINVP